MLTKSERTLFESRHGGSNILSAKDEQTYPTASEVLHEMALTLAGFLGIAVVINLLLIAFGG
ncbi:hypothetical protein [Azospirillum sp. TSO22-1]|uniref:hypothetical protein n=1 Tax=Azospirillum sp. TSO22-1 TaxID=716789 RepID=UPI000D61ADAD|nr:hypothetical protein [Azospirillum sp. TSO22-1]PWC53178.1 hypothetical protein TSO221_11655 [Azospirillum sp. TSO22-1]